MSLRFVDVMLFSFETIFLSSIFKEITSGFPLVFQG